VFYLCIYAANIEIILETAKYFLEKNAQITQITQIFLILSVKYVISTKTN